MTTDSKLVPELLSPDDFNDPFVIDTYASLKPGHPDTQRLISSFFNRAEYLGVDMGFLTQEFNESKALALKYNEPSPMEYPVIEKLDTYWGIVPERPEALIDGILRRGHKMLISGASKAGKSFLLMELAIALAEGTKWLGFPCKKSRVLYINLEIDSSSCINRFVDIYKALGYEQRPPHVNDIEIWNLRGRAVELAQLTDTLIDRVKDRNLDAIIFDPIYKIMMGDENSASDMGKFCNEFDKIATSTGCSVIYAHHHAKGAMGGRKAQDRASGSGVFARDPDAILDIIELLIPEDMRDVIVSPSGRNINASPWRLEGSLREFPSFRPVNFWYDYPLHVLDLDGSLDRLFADGDPYGNLNKSPNRVKSRTPLEKVQEAYEKAKDSLTGSVRLTAMAAELDISAPALRKWINGKFSDNFIIEDGKVYQK